MVFFVKLIYFCLVLLQYIEKTQSLECPVCVHITFKYITMSNSLRNQMKDAFKFLEDIPCKTNTAATTYTCDGGRSAKCESVNLTMTYYYTQTIYPDMEANMLYRGCTIRPTGEADKCEVLKFDDELTTRYLKALQSITNMFKSIKYNGQACYSSHPNRGNYRIISTVSYLVPISLALKIFN